MLRKGIDGTIVSINNAQGIVYTEDECGGMMRVEWVDGRLRYR